MEENMTIDDSPRDAKAWFDKGVSLTELARYEEAIVCYDKTLALDLSQQDPKQIEFARKRLQELGE
jgi:Flp pilus assembly protein TadD